MGLLASQKYDFVLESFREYLRFSGLVFGADDDMDNKIIKDFLRLCDDGEWEIMNMGNNGWR